MDTFTIWLKEQLDKRAWSQSQLARKSGIAQQTISAILSGQQKPGHKALAGIAKGLNLPMTYLMEKAALELPPPDLLIINRICEFLAALPSEDLQAILHVIKHMRQP